MVASNKSSLLGDMKTVSSVAELVYVQLNKKLYTVLNVKKSSKPIVYANFGGF